MNWKTYVDESGPKKKARGNRIELYETLYDTITAWGEDYDSLKFDKNEKVTYNSVEKKEENVSMFDASSMMNRYFGKIANGMIAAGTNVREQIVRPEFVTSVIGSDREDNMARLEL